MKKIVFFPYHPDLKTLIDHRPALRDVQIAGFLSFNEDKNLMSTMNQALGLIDVSDDQLLHDSDAVILLDNFRDYRVDKYYQMIEDAISNHKEIYITPLALKQLDLKNYKGKYQLLEFQPDGMETYQEYNQSPDQKIYDIEVPVIAVVGQGKHCGKFENQLLLKEVLEAEHYTLTVTTNALGALFGCYTLPSFLYQDRPFEEKIIRLNHYIQRIAKMDHPDVIVLGIPEGIAPFERQEFHHFAEYPLVISTAVPIDMAILCTYFSRGQTLENSIKRTVGFCQNKFNIPVCAIAISKTAFEVPRDDTEKIIFEYLDDSYLDHYYPDLKQINLPMINMLKREDATETIKMSLRQLQDNVKAI